MFSGGIEKDQWHEMGQLLRMTVNGVSRCNISCSSQKWYSESALSILRMWFLWSKFIFASGKTGHFTYTMEYLNLHQRKQFFHVFHRTLHKNSFVKNLFGKYEQIRRFVYIYLKEINVRGYLFSRMQILPYFA